MNGDDILNNKKTKYMQVCPLCGKNIPPGIVQQGGLHMDCYMTDIDVWFISLPDAPKHGFCEKDLNQAMKYLESIETDDPHVIQKKIMAAGEYYNLPEFEGF